MKRCVRFFVGALAFWVTLSGLGAALLDFGTWDSFHKEEVDGTFKGLSIGKIKVADLAIAINTFKATYATNQYAKSVVITKRSGFNDGLGNQLTRMIGTYCVCKEFGFSFLFTPVESVELHPSDIAAHLTEKDIVDEANSRLVRFSQASVSAREFENYSRIDAQVLLSKLQVSRNVLVSWTFPHHITTSHSYVLEHARGMWLTKIPKNQHLTVGIHVRRGDLSFRETGRMLPNSYFIDLVKKIADVVPECQYELYWEESPTELGPGFTIQDFHFANLTKFTNLPLFATFDRMVNCDILVASRSSFSTAASLVKDGITIHPVRLFGMDLRPSDLSVHDSAWVQKLRKFVGSRRQI